MDLDRTTQPSREQLARIMDYTLLSPEATAADVGHLIDSAISLGVGAMCVSPSSAACHGESHTGRPDGGHCLWVPIR